MSIISERLSAHSERESTIVAIGLLIVLSFSITLVQDWVGRSTFYSQVRSKTLALHEGILHNRLPAGAQTWKDLGANSVNTRVGVVYFAEAVRRLTGEDVNNVYRVIDSIALFAALIVLFVYLRTFVPESYALLAFSISGPCCP
jgi:hypothetical protein